MDLSLEIKPRAEMGDKGANRRLRSGGSVPGTVVGGPTPPEHVTFDGGAFLEIFRRSGDRNTVLQLRGVSGTTSVLVGEVQRHPLSRALLHVDFRRLGAGVVVEVTVPVTTSGKPKGATMGGRVRIVHRELRVRCPWDRIPKAIDVDVTPLDVGDNVTASAIALPEGASFAARGDFHVVELLGARAELAAAPAAAAPAAGAKAAAPAAAAGGAKAGAAPAKK